MHKDDVFHNFVVNDSLILKFGVILMNKLGLRRKNNIAQHMRQLGRLMQHMNADSMEKVIKGSQFDSVVKGVHGLCKAKMSKEDITISNKKP